MQLARQSQLRLARQAISLTNDLKLVAMQMQWIAALPLIGLEIRALVCCMLGQNTIFRDLVSLRQLTRCAE